MVKLMQLCKAGCKLFDHWYMLESNKKLISVLESNAGIPALELIDNNIGGIHTSTWIHPDLAIQLAQWLSPEFALQVSYLFITLFIKCKVSIKLFTKVINDTVIFFNNLIQLKFFVLKVILIKKIKSSFQTNFYRYQTLSQIFLKI
jgi:hypothetical protein